MAVLEQNQRQGLVLQPSNTQRAEFICSCCGCCCGMLGVHQRLPKPLDFWAANFFAVVDRQLCNGCGVCQKRCQVGAIRVVPRKHQPAGVDLKRCLGCGVCVPTCPTKALSLHKKVSETCPPQSREDLYEIIMRKKKGRLGKMKLASKLVLDTMTTRQLHLLKKRP